MAPFVGGARIDSAVADARSLDLSDASVDAVLLLGPLYHLERRRDRVAALADEVIVAGVFRSEAVPENERLELPALAAEIEQNGRRVRLLADADAIVQSVAPEMRSGDVIAILSNGGFGGIYEKLPTRLRELAETQ